MIPRKVLMAAAVSGVVTFIFCQIGLYDVLNIKRVPASEVYRDLYRKNLVLIDIKNFKFLINNDICSGTPVAIVTIVHSSCKNKAARDIIRATWGSPDISGSVLKLVFLLGMTRDRRLQRSIERENDLHQDLVQGNFRDTYRQKGPQRNLSYKNIMGQLWASEFCEQAEFILKTDDDQYVDLYEALVLARRYSGTVQYLSNRFLLCPVQRGLEIQRDPFSKQ